MLAQHDVKKMTKDTWGALRNMARIKNAGIQDLMHELTMLTMSEEELVTEYAAKLFLVVAEMRTLGEMIEATWSPSCFVWHWENMIPLHCPLRNLEIFTKCHLKKLLDL